MSSANSEQVTEIERSSDARIPWLLVIGVIALGFLLRGWNLHGRGYTADEVTELLLARKPLASVVMDEDDDRFPPLYRTILVIWDNAWGSEEAARWLSVVAGGLTVIVVWRAGAALLDERDAVWPALLMACCPFNIHFAREGRAYAVYGLFAAMMFWAALRLLRRGERRDWALMVASTIAAVYCHWYAVPLGCVLWLFVFYAGWRRDGWRRPIGAAIATAVLLIPAPILLIRASADLPDEELYAGFDLEALGYTFVSLVGGFTIGPAMKELRSMPAADGIRQFLPWLAAVGFAGLTLVWQAVRRLGIGLPLAMLVASSALLVPVLGYLGNVSGSGFVYRYVVWLAVPYALILGAGAARCRVSWFARLAVVVLLAVNAAALYNRAYDARYDEEDFRAVAAKLEELGAAEAPVLVASNYMGHALQHYWPADRSLTSFPIFAHHGEQRAERLAEFQAAHPAGTKYWIVSQWLPEDDVRRETRDAVLTELGAKREAELVQMEIYSAEVR
ncbi:glycosyltransferase family 39 protein [Lacipirellula parvula]|uniref:Glycosyltransferase RgtA/B/C/D-like domain-containing protein n=1 Tax=Lacipirellula parvula TaxID=2650471 RepID=A0A5K7XFA5_9BACT|nr:glycosyltransferase family 39 protein [Lacipirellula parvula]BBO33016.1 hypothetical protein PLANPX_2628 [Lacipirellula parvula]